jgi:hypothetical protein
LLNTTQIAATLKVAPEFIGTYGTRQDTVTCRHDAASRSCAEDFSVTGRGPSSVSIDLTSYIDGTDMSSFLIDWADYYVKQGLTIEESSADRLVVRIMDKDDTLRAQAFEVNGTTLITATCARNFAHRADADVTACSKKLAAAQSAALG